MENIPIMAEASQEKLATPTSETADEKSSDPDPDENLKLGLHHLTLADTGVDRENNLKLAVEYLIKSSKTGNDEATQKLKKCLQDETGVTAENLSDVKWCVNTTSAEKRVRNAARELFQKINSTRKDILSLDDYLAAVKSISENVKEKALLIAAGKKIGEGITETNFVKTLSKNIQGKITLTSEETSVATEAYNSAGYAQKVYQYPKQTVTMIIDQALEFVSKEGSSWLFSLIPINQIYIMLLFFTYGFINPSFVFWIVPLFIFYISICGMVVSTLRMFYGKKKLSDVTTLTTMLKNYDLGINVEDTQSQYSWNSITPYFIFFGSLVSTIISFGLSDKNFIPCSEICIIALFLTGFCFIGLSDSYDVITSVALFCNFLASLPVFFHNVPHIPLVTSFIHLISSPIFSLDIVSGLKINLGLPSLSYIIIPAFFVRMAIKDSWKGTYKALIPHLVCYFWWNFMVTVFPFTSWFGLVRASVGYAIFPLLVPFAFIGVIIGVGYIFYKLLQAQFLGKIIVTIILLAVPVALTQSKALFRKAKGKDGKDGKENKTLVTIKMVVMIVCGVLSVLPLFFIRLPSAVKPAEKLLSLNDYVAQCSVKGGNTVGTQMKCLHYAGMKVKWTGTVNAVKITSVENNIEKLLHDLPLILANPLKCIYGDPYECDVENITSVDLSHCTLMKKHGKECHVRKHDMYKFLLAVSVPVEEETSQSFSMSVNLAAVDKFRATFSALAPGDTINFTAKLDSNLGTSAPFLKLKKLTCTNRILPVMAVIDDDAEEKFLETLQEGFSVVLHFFWFPLVEYSP